MGYVLFNDDTDLWKNFDGKPVGQIRQVVSEYLNQNHTKGSIKVFVGTDSQRTCKDFFTFVNVVVLKIEDGVSKQTRIFYKKRKAMTKFNPAMSNLNYRLLNEVYESIGIAIQISDIVNAKDIEIHLDLNKSPKFKSNNAVQEALMACSGQGFTPVIKPGSFAASSVADILSK